ncbi:MAG: glycosyltransferase family 4 protein [Treponema sp.]|nr:glycosyltransferase family 4 protein [Treponema sp.]
MNPVIHVLGIIIKYLFLNTRVFFQYLRLRNNSITVSAIDTVVFTHNLGGGTESYVRNNFYKNNILIVRLISYRRDSYFLLEHESEKLVIRQKALFAYLNKLSLKLIVVNSLCAYSRPKEILDYAVNNSAQCSLSYLIHDFNAVCPPSTFVMNKKFCKYECSSCSLGNRVIAEWRTMWGSFLNHVNKIICFSNSSKEILCQFYAGIAEKIQVIPHSMDYCTFKPLPFDSSYRNIAVIGNCSNIPKGKLVIKKLIAEVKKTKDRKLYIIGKIPFFFHRNSEYVRYTGAYDLKILPEIIMSNQIGAVVFTSILPETFSYAVSEFMLLGLYIVALDLGAQGEKLRHYDKAVFVPGLDPETILAGVEKCFI